MLSSFILPSHAQQSLPFTETFIQIAPGDYSFPNNWAADNPAPTVVLNSDVNDYGTADGSGSAMFNLFATQGYAEFNLATPVLENPDDLKIKLTFDLASALRKTVPAMLPYTFPDDVFRIYTSLNGGLSYTLFEEHSLSLEADFNTGDFIQMAGFTPTATQWMTYTTTLPAGTNRVLFKIFRPDAGAAGSNFNYLDNVILEVCEAETPTGNAAQYDAAYLTVDDLVVTGTNLTWYSDEELTTQIPTTTPLVEGTTYYVTSTLDDCESDALSVTFDEELASSDSFQFAKMRIYPNPTSNQLNIEGLENFNKAILFDLTGKQILETTHPSFSVNGIAPGVYLLQIYTDNHAMKAEKIIIK